MRGNRERIFSDFDVRVIEELAQPVREMLTQKDRKAYKVKQELWNSIYDKFRDTEGTCKATLVQVKTKWLKVQYLSRKAKTSVLKKQKGQIAGKIEQPRQKLENGYNEEDDSNDAIEEEYTGSKDKRIIGKINLVEDEDKISEDDINRASEDDKERMNEESDRVSEDDDEMEDNRSRFIRHGTPLPSNKNRILRSPRTKTPSSTNKANSSEDSETPAEKSIKYKLIKRKLKYQKRKIKMLEKEHQLRMEILELQKQQLSQPQGTVCTESVVIV